MAECRFSGGQNQGMRRPPPNDVSAVAESWPPLNEPFGGGLKPPPKCHLVVAAVYISIVAATAEMTFGGGRRITCVLCLLFKLRLKLPARCVVLGSWSIKSLAAVL